MKRKIYLWVVNFEEMSGFFLNDSQFWLAENRSDRWISEQTEVLKDAW